MRIRIRIRRAATLFAAPYSLFAELNHDAVLASIPETIWALLRSLGFNPLEILIPPLFHTIYFPNISFDFFEDQPFTFELLC